MLTGMRRVTMLTCLGVSGFSGGALVCPATRAKDAIRDIVRAVITSHRISGRF